MAKATIDLLGTLEKKTAGNLSEDEKRLLQHALYELRMNYVDEVKKPDPEGSEARAEAADEAKSGEGKESEEESKS